ncbi:MAG: hypothetical protein VX077_05020 [Pseudomonadota bacterium]|nr:hypothetical protein [Pseudomonadota bacterium]
MDLEIDLRKLGLVALQLAREVGGQQRGRDGKVHRTHAQAAEVGDLRLDLTQLGQLLAHEGQHQLPGHVWTHAGVGALEQWRAVFFLEIEDPAVQGRGGNGGFLGRPAGRTVACYGVQQSVGQ